MDFGGPWKEGFFHELLNASTMSECTVCSFQHTTFDWQPNIIHVCLADSVYDYAYESTQVANLGPKILVMLLAGGTSVCGLFFDGVASVIARTFPFHGTLGVLSLRKSQFESLIVCNDCTIRKRSK